MKKLIATALASSLIGLAAYAQGTVTFANVGAGLNAPVTLSDHTTKLSGSTFQAILMGGATSTSLALVPGAQAGFLTGGNAGYFVGTAPQVPGVAAGSSGWFEVIAWDTTLGGTTTGATEAQALAYSQAGHGNVWGTSPVFSNVTGGVGNPPTAPATLTGLTPFSLNAVPEPSTFALAGLGAAALMIFRRRK